MGSGRYDVAQICSNGHVINKYARTMPRFNKEFCDTCGARTIIACQKCNASIQGCYDSGLVIIGPSEPFPAPAFCHNCGAPYRWTEKRREAARELVAEEKGLTQEEKATLAKDVDDLIADNPRTKVAATRWKKGLAKMGKETAHALHEILIDIASETAKKTIWPHG